MKQLARVLAFGVFAIALLAPMTARAEAPSEADLARALGKSKSPWVPVVFSKLKGDMTPEEVGKIFPGAEKISKYGFVTLAANGVPGATEFEFYFAKDKKTDIPTQLKNAKIVFHKNLTNDEEFYKVLIKVLEAKFGKIKKPDSIPKKQITWIGPKFKSVQLWKMPNRGGDQLELKVSL